MFIIKKNYYFYIDNTELINLNSFLNSKKITIIYRNIKNLECIKKIIRFAQICKKKKIKLFIANDYRLARICKADGLYLSAHNKKIYKNFNTIGSAHNYSEINQKIKQGCKKIIFSRLFKTTYANKNSFYGIIKFNLIIKNSNFNLIPLGGIRNSNLLKLNLINSNSFAIFSEIKKKPAIANRLF
jgi:thiamine monophosphate synthase